MKTTAPIDEPESTQAGCWRSCSVDGEICRSFEATSPESVSSSQPATVRERTREDPCPPAIGAKDESAAFEVPPKDIGIDALTQIICCPRCHSRLARRESLQPPIVCRNAECEYSRQGFLEVFGQPVLVDFDSSILSRDEFLRRKGESYLSRDENRSKAMTRAFDFLFGTNYVARACCLKFLAQLKRDSKRPRVLVIGGGARGSGAEALYNDNSIDLVGTDIYASFNTRIVADGHQLPFIDGSFDGVWIQAVLEHVLAPPIVVAEIFRVLRPEGLVYADTPFMQQVHENAYDFTRYTVSGHRWLFRNFALLDAGASSEGAGSALRWSVQYLVRSITGSHRLGRAVSLLFFWTRFLDRVGKRRPNADAASGVYFLGRKATAPIRPRDMISFYEQQAFSPSERATEAPVPAPIGGRRPVE